MNFCFATCDRLHALKFLQQLHPETGVDADKASDLLDLVEADEIRICDPSYHGGAIILGTNAKPDTTDKTRAALTKSGLCFGENKESENAQ